MQNKDDMALIRPGDLAEAVGLLTRFPINLRHELRGARAAWAYPVAGLLVGAFGALLAWVFGGLPPALTAGLILLGGIIVTGALHEDGLADCADGFWGGYTSARRMEIMKDSRIGAYGVLALVFGVGLKWAALTALVSAGGAWAAIIAAAVLSRAAMLMTMHMLPQARPGGLSALTGHPPAVTTGLGLGLGALLGLIALGTSGIALILILAGITTTLMALARAKIGGQTGDVLGATQQVTEIAALIALTVI